MLLVSGLPAQCWVFQRGDFQEIPLPLAGSSAGCISSAATGKTERQTKNTVANDNDQMKQKQMSVRGHTKLIQEC